MADQEPATVRVELVPYSMFAATPAYQIQAELETGVENVVVFGLKRDAVVPDPSDILFTVPTGGGGRLDLISQKFYGTPELWWAISRCNPEIDPMIGPNVADVIRVPARLRLASLGVLNV
jgi:hypothetical protein